MAAKPIHLSLPEARRVWAWRQGLGAEPAARQGWLRAIGGVDPYLSLWARDPSRTRGSIDAAVGQGELRVVPGVRGCMWVVSRADAGLALGLGDAENRKRLLREMAGLGVARAELDRLGAATLAVLAAGPVTNEALRAALPDDAVRSLGDAGKKKGHSTTMPTALRLLEGDGRIVRLQADGGIDSNRYLWALPAALPGAPAAPETDLEAMTLALTERFFDWAGPASMSELTDFTAFGKRAAAAAVANLQLVPVEIEGADEPALYPAAALDALKAALAAPSDVVHLLPAQDNLMAMRTKPALLADPEHHGITLPSMGSTSKTSTVAEARWWSMHPLIHDGRFAGVWEWDMDAGEVVCAPFSPLPAAANAALARRAAALGDFIRDSLGGVVRANAIDSEARQRARLAAARALQTR
ncbi:MAG: crosslink repair DNA glycosylase YcaQ family protein [Myxococcota bacterium]